MARPKGSKNKRTNKSPKAAVKKSIANEVNISTEKTEKYVITVGGLKIEEMLINNAVKKAGFNPETTIFEDIKVKYGREGATITLLNPAKENKIKEKPVKLEAEQKVVDKVNTEFPNT